MFVTRKIALGLHSNNNEDMKKRSVSGNETSSRQLHRRESRSKANSIQTHKEDEKDKSQRKRRKVRLGLTDLSPIQDQSPESCPKRQDISKRDSRLETPKSKKSAYLLDSTPFKDDILLASQGYDAQCDVRWDCTSPDALRYIRKNRRRHHSSDVAGIVQLLIPEESQEEDAGSSTNTPPLLGLWMNSSNQPTHASKDDKSGRSTLPGYSSKLARFRKKEKAKSNASRDAKMPAELLEKLKLAVEKCDGQSTASTEEVAEIDKDTKKDESPEGFDKSKDLFASTEAARSELNRAEASPTLIWSDDEIFENEELMKATQDPDVESKDKRGNKRKSHEIKASKSKMSKVCLDTHQSNLPVNKKQTKGAIPYKMLQGRKERSPFRKVKSFNDIDCVQNKPTNDLRQSKGRKCLLLRNIDNVTQTVTTVPTSKSVGRMTVNQGSSVTSNQTTQSTHALAMDKKQCTAHGNPPAEIKTPVDPSASKVLGNMPSTSATNNYSVTGGNSSVSTTTRTSTHHSGLVDTCSVRPNKVCDKSTSVPVQKTSNSLKYQVSISSRTFNVAKAQSIGSCVVGTGTQNLVKSNKINSGLQGVGSTVQSASTTTASRRRSSGIFDTSLSDDLLCQLAEPDELLDSQVSQNTNNIVKSQSVGATLHEGKPMQRVSSTKCVSVSCDRPKSSLLFPASSKESGTTTGLKQVPINSNISKSGCANYNIPRTSQSGVSGNVRSAAESVTTVSQVSSSQRSRFKFKSKSVNSGIGVLTPVSTVTTKMSANLPTFVNAPEISKLTDAAAVTKSTGPSLGDNSEDLFNSDDDELSEQQILAMLDTVEMEASQIPIVSQSQQDSKMSASTFPSKCSVNEIEQKKHAAKAKLLKKKAEAVSPETLSQDTSPIKLSPTKYTVEEIERKKQAALEKRRAKCKEILPDSSNVINQYKPDFEVRKQQNVSTKKPSAIQSSSSGSPGKCQQDDIERKRLAALGRLKLKEENVKKCISSSSSSERNSLSPGKCTQEEIERKKLAALERKKHVSGDMIKARHHSDSSPGFSSSQSAESSPFKCTPEEIEKKKLAALAKLKIRKNLCSQLSSKGN